MGAVSTFTGFMLASIVAAGAQMPALTKPRPVEDSSYAAAKPKCKSGYKAGVTAVTLRAGAKLACVNVASVTRGKKLLTSISSTCSACHMASGIMPYSTMPKNLKTQGFSLAAQSILDAFNQHSELMPGQALSLKQAKDLSQLFQTLKIK